MTLIKRYPARLHTAFWGPPMCTEERKTLRTRRGRGGAAIRDKESRGKDFNRGRHRHNSIDLNDVQHREQDRDKYTVLVCKLEQTTGPTDDSLNQRRGCFSSDLSSYTCNAPPLSIFKQWCLSPSSITQI